MPTFLAFRGAAWVACARAGAKLKHGKTDTSKGSRNISIESVIVIESIYMYLLFTVLQWKTAKSRTFPSVNLRAKAVGMRPLLGFFGGTLEADSNFLIFVRFV